MKDLPNVEKSAFKRGEYVAYDGQGYAWRVRKENAGWRATPAANNPARGIGTVVLDDTLTHLAGRLAARQAPRVVEPF